MKSMINSDRDDNETDPLTRLGLPSPLILGSGSFTRKLILKDMGIPFHLLVRPIDEQSIGDRDRDHPALLVKTLAKAKCDHLVSEMLSGNVDHDLPCTSSIRGWIVLAGDQVVTCDDSILEKPVDVAQAKEFVSKYAKHAPQTVGAVVVTHVPSGIQVCGVDSATIVFRPSIGKADLVDALMVEGAPVLSCAGGLMVEHPMVKEHLERIDGTEDSVMGLSKDLVLNLLKELRDALKEAGVL